ncbi:MAG TPA: hypothetical protein VGM45_07470 [Gaiellaceae bacterium]|jgi:hypothetical protein
MTAAVDDARSQAFDAFLRQREAEGYMIETRTGMQAVIYRRHRLHFLLRLVTSGSESRRLLVSVDRHARITSVAVKPTA